MNGNYSNTRSPGLKFGSSPSHMAVSKADSGRGSGAGGGKSDTPKTGPKALSNNGKAST